MRFGLETFRNDPHADRMAFPAQSSVLDENALLHRIVRQYDIHEPSGCYFLSRGWADVYRVCAAGSTFYLKVYRPPYTQDRTEVEAHLVNDLHARGAPVAPAVKRRDGRYASQVAAPEGPRPILLFEAAPPTPLPPLDAGLCQALGISVARLHEAMDALVQRYALPTMDAESVFCELMPYAQARMGPQDVARLNNVTRCARQCLAKLSAQSPDFGLCHKDLATVNMRMAEDGSVTFFDFSEACYTWRAIDLGRLHGLVKHHASANASALWGTLRAAYTSIRPVPAGLQESLPVIQLVGQTGRFLYGIACCHLRMGEENFGQATIAQGLAEIEELVKEVDGRP